MCKARIMIVASALALLLVACSGGDEKATETKTAAAVAPKISKEDKSRCDVKGKRIVKLDLNRDKQPDVWKLYESKTEGGAKIEFLACKEIDLNFDGRKDMWVYYSDNGDRTMEEMDLDFDGRIDIVTFRRGGKVERQELDTNFDGKPDIWKHFEEEVLVRVDRDTNGNGKVDFWEYYEGGRLDRVGHDKDGDGKVDSWNRAPDRETAAGPEAEQGAPKGEEPKGEEEEAKSATK